MAKKQQKVKKLKIKRDPSKTYRVRDGKVYASTSSIETHGGGNVIVIPSDDGGFELLVDTGLKHEPGWIYFLDEQGDLSRVAM